SVAQCRDLVTKLLQIVGSFGGRQSCRGELVVDETPDVIALGVQLKVEGETGCSLPAICECQEAPALCRLPLLPRLGRSRVLEERRYGAPKKELGTPHHRPEELSPVRLPLAAAAASERAVARVWEELAEDLSGLVVFSAVPHGNRDLDGSRREHGGKQARQRVAGRCARSAGQSADILGILILVELDQLEDVRIVGALEGAWYVTPPSSLRRSFGGEVFGAAFIA